MFRICSTKGVIRSFSPVDMEKEWLEPYAKDDVNLC